MNVHSLVMLTKITFTVETQDTFVKKKCDYGKFLQDSCINILGNTVDLKG